MRVVVGSVNPVKGLAVQEAFTKYFKKFEVIPIAVTSGVHPFPMSQQETLEGSINRAKQAKRKIGDADFYVGIEGGLLLFNNHHYIQAIAAVIKGSEISVARSVAIEVSKRIVEQIDPTSDQSKRTIDHLLGRENLFQHEGVMGVLTQNKLTRTQILRDTVICALPRFLVPDYYL